LTFGRIGHLFLTVRRLGQIISAGSRFYVLPALRPGKVALPPEVRLRLFLESLGGAWIKIGQALALRFDLLPEKYCSELLKLLNQTPAVPYEAIRQTIFQELGSFPEQIFASFDPVPHATASIAQVHIATTRDGEKLAIKVQRPFVQEQFEADFRILHMITALVGFRDALGGSALRSFTEEFERWSREELDFTTEARNSHRMHMRAERDPIQVCAEIRFEFCSTRVLATKLLEGVSLLDVSNAARARNHLSLRDLGLQPDDVQEIARNFFWSIYNQIFRDGLFHADPHPANIFVLRGNRIGFLDFGAIGRLSKEFRSTLARVALHLYRGDIEQTVTENFKLLVPSKDSDLRQAREEFFVAYQMYRFALDIPKANVRRLTTTLLIDSMTIARRHKILMPQELSIYYKTIITVDAVMSDLAPGYDWISELPEFFRQGFINDVRERLWRWPEVVMVTKYRAGRLLADANNLTASFRFFNPALKSIQTRAVLYGIYSITFCVAAYLGAKGDMSLLNDIFGLSNRWIVFVCIGAAMASMLLMQRQIRNIRKIKT